MKVGFEGVYFTRTCFHDVTYNYIMSAGRKRKSYHALSVSPYNIVRHNSTEPQRPHLPSEDRKETVFQTAVQFSAATTCGKYTSLVRDRD